VTDPATPQDAQSSAVGRRVGWIELFFDLAFVAFITQLAHGLHGAPQPYDFLLFVIWSVPAWWAWSNVMIVVNLLPPIPMRQLGIGLLISMGLVGLMAASVTGDTERAWAFALAYAGLRIVLLVLWAYRGARGGQRVLRSVIFNGPTLVIWIASVFVPSPWNFVLWGVALLIEILTLRLFDYAANGQPIVDAAHASERLGLFMIILMGESVLSVVTSLAQHWTLLPGIAALLGFVAIAALAWGFFVYGTDTMEHGLATLSGRQDVAGLLDTVMVIPYLLVVAVTTFAAGLATAITDPTDPLPLGAALCLGGGIALFYLTNALVSRRWGVAWRRLLPWALPGILLPLVVIATVGRISALLSLAIIAVVVLGLTIRASFAEDRRLARGAST
jgi:low temperature requirement protein LtrA